MPSLSLGAGRGEGSGGVGVPLCDGEAFAGMNEADEISLFGVLHEEIGMGHQFELQGGFFYRLGGPPPCGPRSPSPTITSGMARFARPGHDSFVFTLLCTTAMSSANHSA